MDTAAGTVRMRTHPAQALDVYNISTASGANVDTWTSWGGPGQLWNFVP